MKELTELIKNKIKKMYGTPENFAESTGFPYETIIEVTSGNIGDLTYDEVKGICTILQITIDFYPTGIPVPVKSGLITQLDDKGIQRVYSAAVSEHNRLLKKTGSST